MLHPSVRTNLYVFELIVPGGCLIPCAACVHEPTSQTPSTGFTMSFFLKVPENDAPDPERAHVHKSDSRDFLTKV